MSISGNKAPVVTSEMLGGIKQYEVKKGSKKMQAQVGSMGLQLFAGGKPADNYLYQSMAGWGEEDGALQIDFQDDTQVILKTADAEEIAEAMTAEAMKLAKAHKRVVLVVCGLSVGVSGTP